MRSKGRLGTVMLLACLFGGTACSTESGSSSTRGQSPSELKAAATSTETLPPGVIARVGSFDILSERVSLIAQAQNLSVREARDVEIRDALFASGAVDRKLSDAPGVRAALRGRLARSVLSRIAQETATAEPSDEEVSAATARHFVDLDRPETFRVIHAVARVSSTADAATKARARDVAERIKRAVARVKDPAEFRSRAEAVERGGFEVIIEELKPVAADGRVVDPEGPRTLGDEVEHYVAPFAAAAARLAQPGDHSDLVETEFGWHVIMLTERRAAYTVPLEERRRMLRDEIITGRAKRTAEELRNELRSRYKPAIERSAETLLADVGTPSQ